MITHNIVGDHVRLDALLLHLDVPVLRALGVARACARVHYGVVANNVCCEARPADLSHQPLRSPSVVLLGRLVDGLVPTCESGATGGFVRLLLPRVQRSLCGGTGAVLRSLCSLTWREARLRLFGLP